MLACSTGGRTGMAYSMDLRRSVAAQPSAVSTAFTLPDGFATPTPTPSDLLGYNATTQDYANILNTQGEVTIRTYYQPTDSEGNDTLAGAASGFLKESWLQRGDGGGTSNFTSPVKQESRH